VYLIGVNPALWKIVCVGASILLTSLHPDEFDKVDGMDSMKQIWDTLQINHEGTR
jgi:hypothetical protein